MAILGTRRDLEGPRLHISWMKYLGIVLVLLGGCWSMYIGPRVDSEGHVGAEFGVSVGLTVPTKRGAVSASVDTSIPISDTAACSSECAMTDARSTPPSTTESRSRPPGIAIRGVIDWSVRSDIGFRAGVYGGAMSRSRDSYVGLVGAQVTISPWVGVRDDGHGNLLFMSLGLQLGAEALADGTYVGRAALVTDMQVLFRRRR